LKSAIIVSTAALILLLSVAAPSASALVIGAHSPVTVLLTDPNGGQFGCTSAGCYYLCTNFSPCLTTSGARDFTNTLGVNPSNGNSECDPICAYSVDLFHTPKDPTTWIDIPNPIPGVWTITYYSTLTGTETGTFTLTASTCGPNGKCSVFCDVFFLSPAFRLCDPKYKPSGEITVFGGSVGPTSTGGTINLLGVNSDGTPYVNFIVTSQYPLGSVAAALVPAVTLLGYATYRRGRPNKPLVN